MRPVPSYADRSETGFTAKRDSSPTGRFEGSRRFLCSLSYKNSWRIVWLCGLATTAGVQTHGRRRQLSVRELPCRGHRRSAAPDPMYGPAVRCKRVSSSWRWAVLHQCIRPLIGARSAPDHHGYQRACELITGQASAGHLGHQCSHAPGRPDLHLVSSSRRPRQV